MSEKPSALIIGGLGYIGRFLALHIQQNNLASEIRIVDKLIPQLAWLAPEFDEACSKENFQQADATKEKSLTTIFTRSNGKEWDYVFNCGGETRFSQGEATYRARSLELSLALGKEAAKRGVKVFVELSTGMVYKPNSSPSKEGDVLAPRSTISKYKLSAEEALLEIEGLNLVIARLPVVYGDYVQQIFGTIFCLARVYQHLGEEMKWLGLSDQKLNIVHVADVARALWEMATWYVVRNKVNWDAHAFGKVPIFNIVDQGQTSQGMFADIISEIFNIKIVFHGPSSRIGRLEKSRLVAILNEETLGPWSKLLSDSGITRPIPLTPFAEVEMFKIIDLSMDGSRFQEVVGFTYNHPRINRDLVQSVINSYIRIGWWPVKADETEKGLAF
ncbi:hypothetical protein K3495_g7223 [Podosphaera aphanis]|nr:hypothetical protein K3495_g7223 [Podosphaera aphanis]